jgi:peptidyl-prolyl cis-trans isomerase B (cyclophilin B)
LTPELRLTILRRPNPVRFDKENVMRACLKGRLGSGVVLALVLAVGCSKTEGPPAVAPEPKPALAVDAKKAEPNSPPTTDAAAPFKDAVLFEPPDGEKRPPDRTAAGKNVAALFEAIAGQEGAPGLWDRIALTTPDGQCIRYAARITTGLGTIEIELYSDAAPNHVRNFIALARAGYYDGLSFHRAVRQQVEGEMLALLEGGCPLGTGEFGIGSIGYWLGPEISSRLSHGVGTVGAVHGEALESAACKFYVSLSKAPGMDGGYTIFGKITKGLDIAQAIHKRPVESGEMSERPVEPVVIRQVTIHALPQGAAGLARRP